MRDRLHEVGYLRRAALVGAVFAVMLTGLLPVSCAKVQLDETTINEGLLTTIPFRLYGSIILIELTVDDSPPLDFVFDTGASGTLLNARTAASLGVAGDESVSRQGASGGASVSLSKDHTISGGDLKLDKATLGIADLSQIERKVGTAIDGVIGWPILSRHALRVNYDSREIEIYDNQRFSYTLSTERVTLDIRGSTIFADVTVSFDDSSTLAGRALVDTGHAGAFSFNTPFAEDHDLLAKAGAYYESQALSLSTESFPIYITTLDGLEVADYSFTSLPASIAFVETGALSWSGPMGILGNDVLKRFNMFIDVKQKAMYLDPNQMFENAFEVNCSGLELMMDAGLKKVVVDRVHSGSAADEAGLREGDQIVQLAGIDVSTLELPEVRGLLSQDGKEVEVLVDREGELLTVELRLRRLI